MKYNLDTFFCYPILVPIAAVTARILLQYISSPCQGGSVQAHCDQIIDANHREAEPEAKTASGSHKKNNGFF